MELGKFKRNLSGTQNELTAAKCRTSASKQWTMSATAFELFLLVAKSA